MLFVQERLKSLEEELEEEEITLKGFWKKKWTLLEHLLTKEQVKRTKSPRRESNKISVVSRGNFSPGSTYGNVP
jgi:hypothetical protein